MPGAIYALCVQRVSSSTCESGWWPVRATSIEVHGLYPGTYYWQVLAVTGRSTNVAANDGEWAAFTIGATGRNRPGGSQPVAPARPRRVGGR